MTFIGLLLFTALALLLISAVGTVIILSDRKEMDIDITCSECDEFEPRIWNGYCYHYGDRRCPDNNICQHFKHNGNGQAR